LGFGQAFGFRHGQAPVWVLLILGGAAFTLDASVGPYSNPILIPPLFKFTHGYFFFFLEPFRFPLP
jgi:hypothetical protein